MNVYVVFGYFVNRKDIGIVGMYSTYEKAEEALHKAETCLPYDEYDIKDYKVDSSGDLSVCTIN